jgi:hypothetical protein
MNPKIPWTISALLAGACLFLSLTEIKQLAPASPQFVTKEVVREIPSPPQVITKEVVREVPAEIPEGFRRAMEFAVKVGSAQICSEDEMLAGIKSFTVKVALPEGLRNVVSEMDLKDTIELELRKNGVPVSEARGSYTLWYSVDGFWNDSKVTFNYADRLSLYTVAFVLEGSEVRKFSAEVWWNGSTGYAGSQKVAQAIRQNALGLVTRFSNRYLSQNPR